MAKECNIIKLSVFVLSFVFFGTVFCGSLGAAVVTGQNKLDVREGAFEVTYPMGEKRGEVEQSQWASNKGDAAMKVFSFNISYGKVWLQNIVVHSDRSMAKYSAKFYVPENNPFGFSSKPEQDWLEEFPDDDQEWYDYIHFKSQRKRFERSAKPVKPNGPVYSINCYFDEDSEFTINEGITFVGELRVTVVMGSDDKCEKVAMDFEEVLSKFKFRQYTEEEKRNKGLLRR